MEVGDKVRFICAQMHELAPFFYPAPGTVGEIRQKDPRDGFWIQWPEGSTSGSDFWHAATCDLELAI